MLQLDMFGDPARTTEPKTPTASPKQRAAKARRSSLLSKHHYQELCTRFDGLNSADRQRLDIFVDVQLDRARASIEGRGASAQARIEQIQHYALGAAAAAGALLRLAEEIRAETDAAPDSGVQPKSEPPAPTKKRGRPVKAASDATAPKPAKLRAHESYAVAAPAGPPGRLSLTLEEMQANRPLKPPAPKRAQVAP